MELHREEKMEEGDRSDQEQKRGSQRGETNLASNQFPKCSPQPEHPKRFIGLSREEKGEGGDRGDLGEKKESQKGRVQSSQ